MFGVLIARTSQGATITLRAFSGMLDGAWDAPGFVPPIFDRAARDRVEIPGEAHVKSLLAHPVARREASQALMRAIHDTYAIPNARHETRPLRALFAPSEPPAGAGDCAAPKLLAYAFRHALTPIALAEIFVGKSAARTDGAFYPACAQKCGPILAFMRDEAVAPVPAPADPRVVYEDPWLVVVEKPTGLLSVPGRSGDPSVLEWLRARHPGASGPLLVHRLDMDTSGLLVAAKTKDAHAFVQRQFAARTVEKRYVALVDGEPRDDAGVIDLPLRVDPDDRPRQVHDPIFGKRAITEWRVLARNARSRVAFVPRTGRTHQIRVHTALGLGAPIVGDRLYGTPGPRLMLHAEAIAFAHPETQRAIAFTSEAPF
ncbi:MAG: RluA family pseudouridine synthase [Deltaproteobacteria bacterium]|nr:RluA family pseudouridine synthase [Deltaproteobacteria bacterium]